MSDDDGVVKTMGGLGVYSRMRILANVFVDSDGRCPLVVGTSAFSSA